MQIRDICMRQVHLYGACLALSLLKINDRWARKDSKRKTIIVYSLNDQSLHYAITNTEGLVEFYYPEIAANKQTDFSYFYKNNTLKFCTKDAEYAITDTPGNLGISITTKGKTYRWKGNTEVRTNRLAALLKKTYNNVTKIR